MRRLLQLCPLCMLGLACVEPEAQATRTHLAAALAEERRLMPPEQSALLNAWFENVGPRRAHESFGRLVVRAARQQLGREYHDPPQTAQPERLRVELGTFQCVSFVESTLAVARCTWAGERSGACYLREVEAFRYRGGSMHGYPSRLHYFADWIEDNVARGRLQSRSAALGGRPMQIAFTYMSTHPSRYPAMAAPDVAAAIATVEERLSAMTHIVVDQATARQTEADLEAGDLVAIVSSRYPGLLIRHAGFVDPNRAGKPRLLHASSHRKRVMIHAASVAGYLAAQPDRHGMIVARPLAPAHAGTMRRQ